MTEVVGVPSEQDELMKMLAESGLMATPKLDEGDEILEIDEGAELIAGTEMLGEIEEIVLPVEAVEEAPGELLDAVAGELAHEEAKAEAYAGQDSSVDMVEPVVVEATGTPAPKAKRERKEAAAPRAPRFTGTPGEHVAASLGDVNYKEIVDGLAIKIREKAVNLAEHVAAGKPLSVYTQVAVDMLRADGKLSAKALVEQLQVVSKKGGGLGYSIGTARSQAQQQMGLLQAFGVISKSGADAPLNTESAIWARLGTTPVPAA